MIMAMMKDTGVPWIGQIPADWELGKVKYAFDRKKEKSMEKDPTVLSLARAGVKIRDISTNEGQLAASYEGYNLVEPNDLLLNPMDLVSGANCSISKVSGVISPAYVNLRAKIGFEPRYYDYYFKTQYWNMGFFAHGKGVSFENRWTLNDATLRDYYIPMPRLSEQQSIADYLDKTCSKIDAIISETKASIDEYKKLKQSVIFETITRGLDQNVEIKDSGVEWIGKVSKSVVIKKIKYVSNISRGLFNYRPRNAEFLYGGTHPFIQTGDVARANKYLTEYKQTLSDEGTKVSKLFPKGTLTMTIAANVGDVSILGFDAYFPDSVLGISPIDKYSNEYLYYVLSSMKDEFVRVSISNTQENLNVERVKELFVPVFENPEYQKRIIDWLNDKCGCIDSLIIEKEALIKDLESYKKSLIYEVVTGKRRVV